MELSPQAVAATTFKLVKKGYDPDEVNAFKAQVAGSIETAQNQAAAMEARARAAVAKLQELSQQVAAAPAQPEAPASTPATPSDEAGVISRTLLLAQRTADATIADATSEAETLRADARAESTNAIETARATATKLVDDARTEARRAADDERMRAESEVQALVAKREFLLADVEHLEQFAVAQRERLREAASAISELADSPTLADVRRPLLSATEWRTERSDPLPAPTTSDVPVDDAVPVPSSSGSASSGSAPGGSAPVAASPSPDLPVVDVHQVRQHQGIDEPAEVTPSAPAGERATSSAPAGRAATDHDDTPATAPSGPNGGMFRIGGDDLR